MPKGGQEAVLMMPPSRVPTLTVFSLLAVLCGIAAARAQDDPSERPYPHGEWSQDCEICHNIEQWLPIRPGKGFKHSPRVPLEGAHRAAGCRACHKTLEFDKPPATKACVDCHQDIHRGEFGLDCSRCHTPRSFIDRANMVRSHRTFRFPLTGAHTQADCDACHRTQPQGAMTNLSLPTDCAACHFNSTFGTATQRPPAATHPDRTDCATCHTTAMFDFDHRRTGFALVGQHATLACSDCHGQPFNPNLNPACVSCHLQDYNATTDPNHPTAGFPTDCALCHNPTSFAGATFSHSGTSFPLTGAHLALQCLACHADGVYDGKPTDCYSCHRAMYEATADPYHVVAGFSHDCTQCHNTTMFSGARFTQHDSASFPIYSGRHSNRWDRCSDCHTNASTYRDFSCFLCHAQTDTDNRHRNISGYRYDSAACYSCHPRGEGP